MISSSFGVQIDFRGRTYEWRSTVLSGSARLGDARGLAAAWGRAAWGRSRFNRVYLCTGGTGGTGRGEWDVGYLLYFVAVTAAAT